MTDSSELLALASRLLREGNARKAAKVCTVALSLAEPPAAAWGLRGVARVQLGDAQGAEQDLTEALGREPTSIRVHEALLALAQERGALAAALERLSAMAIALKHEELALLHARVCDEMLWPSGAVKGLEALSGDAHASRVRLMLAHRYGYAEDYERVPALLGDSSSFEALDLRCRAALALGDTGAGPLAERLLQAASTEPERLAAIDRALAAGRLQEALSSAQEFGLRDVSARLELWSGDPTSALASDTPLLVAAAQSVRGNWPEVLAAAEARLAQESDDGEAWLWHGEALRHLGAGDAALASMERAARRVEGFHFAVELNRALTKGHLQDVEWMAWLVENKGAQMRERATALRAIEDLLRSMHGNRSSTLTTFDERGWQPLAVPPSARRRARLLQMRVRTRPGAALTGLDEMSQELPSEPIVHTHRGEVLLWMGRYQEALRAFETALELAETTRWAWIGLGAAQMYCGDPSLALETWARSTKIVIPGRTIWVYRAEAYWRLGNAALATEALATSRGLNPGRFCLRILAGLIDGNPEGAIAAVARVAPQFSSDHRAQAAHEAPADALRAMLEMLRGNRALELVTWFSGDAMRVWRPPTDAGDAG